MFANIHWGVTSKNFPGTVVLQYEFSDVQMSSEWRPVHIQYICFSCIQILQRNLNTDGGWGLSYFIPYAFNSTFHSSLEVGGLLSSRAAGRQASLRNYLTATTWDTRKSKSCGFERT